MVAMSNNYWNEEDEDDNDFTGSASETDLQKQLRKMVKAKEKENKELLAKLDSYQKKEREDVVRSVLEKQGVTNPKAARLVLKDLEGDVTEQAVLNWLDDEGDVFGYTAETASRISDQDRGELNRQGRVTEGATTPDRGMDLEMKIDQAQSAEELSRILFSSQS
jgi:hypothetical protein